MELELTVFELTVPNLYFENKLLLDKSLKAEICDEKTTWTMNCDDEDMNREFLLYTVR